MATEPEEIKQKSQVTGQQVALVVGGAVVLLALFWFFFLKGGGEEEVAAPPTGPAVTTPAPTEDPGGGSDKGDGDKPPVETFEVFASRDPFKPLLTEGDGEGAATDGSGDTTTDTGDTSTDTGEPPTTDTDGDGDVDEDDDPDDGSGGGSGDENVEGHTVQLISVNGQGGNATVSIQVDDTVYEVTQGETFAENFELLSTSGECATVLFGDDQFTVCEGEEILK